MLMKRRFSSFVESHGRSLLSLSLYVSSHNYDVVRPLYNKIQPFPLPYLTPPSVRSAAKLRTAHLGLSSLDMDTDPTIPPSSDPHSLIPASLRTKAPSVTSLLSTSPETNSRIRLDALAQNFFEPLQEFKNSKRFFVSESQFSSLDCLALGFLSLMLIPELPQSWLRDTMKEKYPELCEYVEVLRQDIYGLGLDVADAFQPQPQSEKKHARKLPWKSPNSGGILGISGVFISSIADSIPIFGQLRRNTRMRQHGGKTTENDISSSYLGYLTAAGATVGVLAGLLFYGGLSPFESQGGRFAGMLGGAKEKKRLRDLGEAGLLFNEQFDFEERQMRHQPMGHETKIPVVDVEVSRDGVSASDDVI
ncbi:hypothetical protein B7494_g855 [Chlorociboria aeruginascens]|nr:hypothetical protein B7494_g855 [Chlorociboria aeruginascens]